MEKRKRLLEAAKNADGRSLTSGRETASPLNEWHLLILIGIYTGLRLGDCCRLDWSQISLAQGVIQLVPRKTRRHHQRMVTIPIHPALGAALVGQQQAYDSKEGARRNGEPRRGRRGATARGRIIVSGMSLRIVTGDSGNPAFLLVGSEPILYVTFEEVKTVTAP